MDVAPTRPTRIAVIGMGRSGTTLATEILGAAGVYLGDVNWAAENEHARAINDAYLERHFGAREGLPYGRLPRGEISVADEAVREQARAFVAAMDAGAAGGRYWAFKDPRTTILADLWLEHMDLTVGVFRRPGAVADSFVARGWVHGLQGRRRALAYWHRFNESLIRVHDTRADAVRLVELTGDFPAQMRALLASLELGPEAASDDVFDAARDSSGDSGARRRDRSLYRELVERRAFA